MESKSFSLVLHSIEKLLSLDLKRMKYIALVVFCVNNCLVIMTWSTRAEGPAFSP